MAKSKFLSTAIQAAKNAEDIILKYYSNRLTWDRKKDKSPVTIADTEAENIIIQTIREEFPDHSFFGEESGDDNTISEYQWIIDPIDGTKNYTHKIPLFATQIALLKNDEIVLGVSNAPALKELVYAEKGAGAYFHKSKTRVSDVNQLSEAYMCFGGIEYFRDTGKLDNLLELVDTTYGHRGIGDFWCYHLLAEGKIDIMIEARTKIWDIAAMKIIVEEAGGKITDICGKHVNKDTTSIIATNGKLHEAVVKFFN